ncbi:non-homologous end-joining DNA ligase [Pseudonocardia sp. TRM90224]|uniref:non-homologous end-joining DNA ligase n=1 Tax=Pseudonocardia sp. TRM90224 TaxID=2812678 RepID=UPI001E3BCF5F|nr:non-homologous end-joining DNA ligase [Pseudonocardia sp. TRM90224]
MTGSLPAPIAPMLATTGTPPAGPGWAFEFKWDGVRAVVGVAGDEWRATSRNGNDLTGGYPELAVLPDALDGRRVVLDGELVALDDGGRPDFGLLQHRMHVRGPAPDLVAQVPVFFYVFDLLVVDDESLVAQPYVDRRDRLLELGLQDHAPRLQVPPSVDGLTGAELMGVARQHGLEGIVAKRRAARYEPGRRSPAWVKTALVQTQEVLIGGWRQGKGRRANGLGALLLGAYDGEGVLQYIGDVGTGFTDRMLDDLLRALVPLGRATSPFAEVPREYARGAQWVEPGLVGEVEFRRWTHDRRLRHAAWRGLRADKDPGDVRVP